jgi:hypothetical protein
MTSESAMRRFTLEVGMLYRRRIRRFLMGQGIDFREDSGLLDSLFVITATDEQILRVRSLAESMS